MACVRVLMMMPPPVSIRLPGLMTFVTVEAALAELGERRLARESVGVEAGVAERDLVLRVGVDRLGAEVAVDPLSVEEMLGLQGLLNEQHAGLWHPG